MLFNVTRKLRRTPTGLLAVMVLATLFATVAIAQTTLQGQVGLRPLSRDDIAAYGIPSTAELSGGLSTVGIGNPVYLEAQVDNAIPAEEIKNVSWAITSKPSGSSAVLAESPITQAAPVYEPSDRLIRQVAGRKLLRPDVAGQYTITATVETANNGSATWKQVITAGTYVGAKTCGACHSGALAPNTMGPWSKTAHASIFKDNINGLDGPTYASTCWGCHTVGFNTNPAAVNGGFDDVMAKLGWTPPATMQEGNWDAVPDGLKTLANIQCENCHGPGSQHIASAGSKAQISVSVNSGDCGQCHGAATHHVKSGEWGNSTHAVVTRDAAGDGREACVGCHTGTGFTAKMKGSATVDTAYNPINCQSCHEPHGQTAPDSAAQLVRNLNSVKLANGTEVTNGGTGLLCMNCHQARQNAETYAATTAGSARFGPHHGTQADMLAGTNGFSYGQKIETSAHGSVVENACVSCHMQTVDAADASLTHVGGHTFKTSWTDADGTTHNQVAACQNCHGSDVTTFDMAKQDYDGDGVVEGVQTEVQHLLDKLALQLPPMGEPKDALTIDATWTRAQLEASYNWQFVKNDGSRGIHNTAYAVGLLKASIADLAGKK
jgi:hypothetical protein